MMRRRKSSFKPILPRSAGSTPLASAKVKQKRIPAIHEKADSTVTDLSSPVATAQICENKVEETLSQPANSSAQLEEIPSTFSQTQDISSSASSQLLDSSSPTQVPEVSVVSSSQSQDSSICSAQLQSASPDLTQTPITCSPLLVASQEDATTIAKSSTLSLHKSPPAGTALKSASSSSKPRKHPPKDQEGSETKSYKQRIALNKLKRMELHKIADENKWGSLDRNMLSMCDLIYINPSKSDGKELGIRAKLRQLKDASSQETEQLPALLQPNVEHDDAPEEPLEEAPEEQALVPQIRVNEEGAIVLDEESLTIKSPQRAGAAALQSSAVYESGISNVNQCSFRRRTAKSRWTDKQTAKFYFALSVVGADFGLMSAMFRHRSRDELRRKFHLENRKNLAKVDEALKSQHLSKWTNEMFMPKSSSEDEASNNSQPRKKRKQKNATNKLINNTDNANKNKNFTNYIDDNAPSAAPLEEPVTLSTLDLAADVTVFSD